MTCEDDRALADEAGIGFTDVLTDALMVENGKPLGLTAPTFAPATATGPVTMCPPARGMPDAWIAASAGGIAMPRPAGGMTSGAPETHSRVTVSPGWTVMTGGKAASNIPHRTVSGEGEML